MIQGIIFDLDGVICHTDHYHYLAWKKIADKLNIYFDEEINNRLRGVSRMESLDIVLEKGNGTYSPETREQLAEEKNEIYKELLKQMSEKDLDDAVKHTLTCLKDKGMKLAIGSSSKNAKTILRQIGLLDFFDAISDGNNIKRSKPDPEVFLCAADMIGLKPEQCLIVEDAVAGIEAGKAGGFSTAAIGDAVSECQADYSIQKLSQLLKGVWE